MTGYNPSGEAIERGKGDINRIYRLCLHYDRIQSERDSNQISVRDISSVDVCSGSTRRFVILWMNVIENLQDGCAKTIM